MKRGFAVLMALALSWACQSKMEGPIRTIENGVEVVDNGTGIYAVPGQPSALSLREEFRIDLEDEALAAAGLSDIVAIDADSKGRIYLFRSMRTVGPLIYQFDGDGRFLKSFGRMGQGPGEAQYPGYLRISPADEIRVHSQAPNRVLIFDGDGRLIREDKITYDPLNRPSQFVPLANGRYVARHYQMPEGEQPISKTGLALFGPDFKLIKEIREFEVPTSIKPGLQILGVIPIVGASGTSFYVNWGSEGRDIAVFDLDGKLRRIIRAAFPSPPVPAEYKKSILDRIPQNSGTLEFRSFIEDMSSFPPYQSFLADEKGRLFVVSFEKDSGSGANLCQVFTPDGVRILRAGVGYQDFFRYMVDTIPFDVVLKNGRAYCVREKPSGFKEVVVYAMIWK